MTPRILWPNDFDLAKVYRLASRRALLVRSFSETEKTTADAAEFNLTLKRGYRLLWLTALRFGSLGQILIYIDGKHDCIHVRDVLCGRHVFRHDAHKSGLLIFFLQKEENEIKK